MPDFQGVLLEIQAVLTSSNYPHDVLLQVFSMRKYFLRQQNKTGSYMGICTFYVCDTILKLY